MARDTGITLFELLVVTAIMGILAAISIPGAAAVHRHRAGESGARELVLVLRQAQARAQAHGAFVSVRVAASGAYVVGESAGPSSVEAATRIATGSLESGASSTYPDGAVAFGVRGWPTLPASTIPRAGSFALSGGHRVVVQLGGCIRCQ